MKVIMILAFKFIFEQIKIVLSSSNNHKQSIIEVEEAFATKACGIDICIVRLLVCFCNSIHDTFFCSVAQKIVGFASSGLPLDIALTVTKKCKKINLDFIAGKLKQYDIRLQLSNISHISLKRCPWMDFAFCGVRVSGAIW